MIYIAIYKCKNCNEKIVDEDAKFKKLDVAIKDIKKRNITHTCESNTAGRTVGVLELVGFWEKK
jgi:hypothetical protein